MTDVEELLRQTLTDPRHKVDPGVGLYETVQSRARGRRHRRTTVMLAAAAVIAVAAVGTTLGVRSSAQHRASPVNVPSGAPVQGTIGHSIDIGTNSFTVTDAVTTTDALYVLASDPNKLVLLSPDGTQVKETADGPEGTPTGLSLSAGRVWVWSQDSDKGRSDVRAYAARTLAFLGEFTVDGAIFNAIAIDDALYFNSDHGLQVAHTDVQKNGVITTIEGSVVTGSTYGLAADPARHRVLVGVTPTASAPPNGFAGARIVAIDTRTGKVVAQSAQTSLGKESIAVVDNQVWVAGYGDVDKPHLLHLDAKTLRVVGTSPIGAKAGPGSIVWPGQNIVWARGGGNEQLGCLDPKTGAVLETWNAVQGPVTSVGGSAFGVEQGLQQLNLSGGCTG